MIKFLPQKLISAFIAIPRIAGDAALVRQMLGCIDVLVDGPFVLEKKDLALRFRGSSNQRLIDIPATLASGRIVLWDDGYQRGGHYDAKGTR